MPIPPRRSFDDNWARRLEAEESSRSYVIEEQIGEAAVSTEKIQVAAVTDITIVDDGSDVSLTAAYDDYQVLEEVSFTGDGNTLLVTYTDDYDFGGTLVDEVALFYRVRLINDDLSGAVEDERIQVVFAYADIGGGDTFSSRGQECNIPFVVTPSDGVSYTLEFSFGRTRADPSDDLSATSLDRIIYIQTVKR